MNFIKKECTLRYEEVQYLCKIYLTFHILDKKAHFLSIILFKKVFADKMSGYCEIHQTK